MQAVTEIINRVRQVVPTGVRVDHFSETNDRGASAFDQGIVNVIYLSSTFGDAEGLGPAMQEETANIAVLVRTRKMMEPFVGGLALTDTVRRGLMGFRPTGCEGLTLKGVQLLLGDEYQGEQRYQIDFEMIRYVVEHKEAESGPLITRVNIDQSITHEGNETLVGVLEVPDPLNPTP